MLMHICLLGGEQPVVPALAPWSYASTCTWVRAGVRQARGAPEVYVTLLAPT